MTDYLQRWLSHPDGGGRFPDQRDAIAAHDSTCPSLKNAWMPRKGGISCPTDLTDCDGCGITFFNEGLLMAFEDCPESWHYFCACCLAKADCCPCGTAKTTGDHLMPPRMPRPSGRGGIGLLRSRARKDESPSGRFGVRHGIAEPDLKPVQDLRVEGPPGGLGLSDQPCVEVFGKPECDANFMIHDRNCSGRMVA